MIKAVIELGDRYRFISGWRAEGDEYPEPRERISAALQAAAERGQRRGEITRSVPPEWAALAIRSLMLAAIEELSTGAVSEREAERIVNRIVTQGLCPTRRVR